MKNDLMAYQTVIVAIEYECREKPTALAATTAEFWVYKFAERFFAFRTETLKRKIFEEKIYLKAVTGGDAGSNTKMYLVKVTEFVKWEKQI